MLRIFLIMSLLAGSLMAQDKTDLFKKEAAGLQAAVEEAVNSLIPGPAGVLERPRATYLEGYGVVVSLQASFEPSRNPFSSPKTPAEVRKIVNERRKLVQERLEKLIKERVAKMKSVGESESLTIALHLLNSNPADLPDFPSQLQLTAKKQDPTVVIAREF